MPKKLKNIWSEFVSYDNLLYGYREASRGKRHFPSIAAFTLHLEDRLYDLRERLQSGNWHPDKYRCFEIYEPKKRTIHAPAFGDRVVHHALVHVIGPRIESAFIDHSYACRVGKGTHAASKYLWSMLKSARDTMGDRVYVLKADISKYFYSIDHQILKSQLARKISDRRVLIVCGRLIDESPCGSDVGLPLGCLTSQLWANMYLDQFDHFAKDVLGLRYYVRYMDDFVILHHDKAALWNLLARIREYLTEALHLVLNRKTGIYQASQGVDFAGYRHWASHILPRKRNIQAAKNRFAWMTNAYPEELIDLDQVRSSVASFVGYTQHCKGWVSTTSALERLVIRPGPVERERKDGPHK